MVKDHPNASSKLLSYLLPLESAKCIRPAFADTIQVLVGTSESPFTVHESVISAKSPFFRAALQNEWTEAEDKKVRLPDATPEVFESYLHWVYTNEVDLSSIPNIRVQKPHRPKNEPTFFRCAQLWIFADCMIDYDLCNRLTDLTLTRVTTYKVYTTKDVIR
jgi:hypothetical protein